MTMMRNSDYVEMEMRNLKRGSWEGDYDDNPLGISQPSWIDWMKMMILKMNLC